jgi:hypothetical protein
VKLTVFVPSWFNKTNRILNLTATTINSAFLIEPF